MIFGLVELLNILIATLVVGYIFTSVIKSEKSSLSLNRFNWNDFKFSLLIAAPGIILHELSHKFTAIAFGLTSFFQVWPFGLVVGIVLKILGSGFILLAPGYVTSIGATSGQGSIIALAGPLMNLLLFLIASFVVKYNTKLSRRSALFWVYTREINKWLFIFNMLPIPPLDGYNTYGHYLF